MWLARRLGIPHLYDMHSSLPQQLSNFSYSRSALIRGVFERSERAMIEGSQVVITICQELQDTVIDLGAGDRAVLIENVMGGDMESQGEGPAVREEWGIDPEAALILYTGTFEAYQGLDLLFEAAERLARTHPTARILVVGGSEEQVAAARGRLAAGLDVVFTGQRPATEIPSFVAAADILASPRIAGTNTPLKIYSYLRSGRPIVATDLRTHTQVLEPGTALLAPPEPGPFAEALGRLIDDPEARARLAAAAADLAERKYSRAAYVARTQDAYQRLLGQDAVDAPSASTLDTAGGVAAS